MRHDLVDEARPDAGRLETALDNAVAAYPGLPETENLLHGDHLALHSCQLGHADELAPPVGQPGHLDHDMDRRRDLGAGGPGRDVDSAHSDHLLDTRQRVPRRVGVHGRHRAFVARIHRLQHVERLAGADLAEDDAIGPHAQRVLDQVALRHFALAFDVRRAGL